MYYTPPQFYPVDLQHFCVSISFQSEWILTSDLDLHCFQKRKKIRVQRDKGYTQLISSEFNAYQASIKLI